MALPNNLTFVPFDILTAAELNDMVENDQALANGSAIDNDAIDIDTKVDFSSFGYGRLQFLLPLDGVVKPAGTSGMQYTTFLNEGRSGVTSSPTFDYLVIQEAGLYMIIAELYCVDAPRACLHGITATAPGGTSLDRYLSGFSIRQTPDDSNRTFPSRIYTGFIGANTRIGHLVDVGGGSTRFGGPITAPFLTSLTAIRIQ